jgi:hypothetical protein
MTPLIATRTFPNATVAGQPVVLEDHPVYYDYSLGIVTFTAKMAIDSDGSGPSHGDPDQEQDTSLHLNGQPLNADVDRYIVVPPSIIQSVPGIVLGSQCYVSFGGIRSPAVVGDIGPHAKLGEGSIALAEALGIPSSPVNGGVDSGVDFQILVGQAANVNGKQYQIQAS